MVKVPLPIALLVVFVCGIATATLFTFAFAERAGASGGGGDRDLGMIAVTGQFGNGTSALYVLDTKTRQLAVYRMDNDGRAMQFVAARNTTYDFFLDSFGDRSDARYLPARLRRDYKRYVERGGHTDPRETSPEGEESEEESPKEGDIKIPGGRKTGPDIRPLGPPSGPGGG